jgi:SH3/ankyrin repeat-containing protein
VLDLGASPDYRDSRGLTPLYHCAMVGGDPYCCELLLHEHAVIGSTDENGWQEIHQVKHTQTHQGYYSCVFLEVFFCSRNSDFNLKLIWFVCFQIHLTSL